MKKKEMVFMVTSLVIIFFFKFFLYLLLWVICKNLFIIFPLDSTVVRFQQQQTTKPFLLFLFLLNIKLSKDQHLNLITFKGI